MSRKPLSKRTHPKPKAALRLPDSRVTYVHFHGNQPVLLSLIP